MKILACCCLPVRVSCISLAQKTPSFYIHPRQNGQLPDAFLTQSCRSFPSSWHVHIYPTFSLAIITEKPWRPGSICMTYVRLCLPSFVSFCIPIHPKTNGSCVEKWKTSYESAPALSCIHKNVRSAWASGLPLCLLCSSMSFGLRIAFIVLYNILV